MRVLEVLLRGEVVDVGGVGEGLDEFELEFETREAGVEVGIAGERRSRDGGGGGAVYCLVLLLLLASHGVAVLDHHCPVGDVARTVLARSPSPASAQT